MSDEPRIKIFYNKNLGMSPGKLAAQAVHSALYLFGVHPGYPVVVLAANKGRVASQEAVVIDEGRTEIPPNSTTAGASFEFPAEHDGDMSEEEHRLDLAIKTYAKARVELSRARQAYYKKQGLDTTNE